MDEELTEQLTKFISDFQNMKTNADIGSDPEAYKINADIGSDPEAYMVCKNASSQNTNPLVNHVWATSEGGDWTTIGSYHPPKKEISRTIFSGERFGMHGVNIIGGSCYVTSKEADLFGKVNELPTYEEFELHRGMITPNSNIYRIKVLLLEICLNATCGQDLVSLQELSRLQRTWVEQFEEGGYFHELLDNAEFIHHIVDRIVAIEGVAKDYFLDEDVLTGQHRLILDLILKKDKEEQ